MSNILNKCPVCGGSLELADLIQYTQYYTIGKRGKMLCRPKRTVCEGPMEASFIVCENEDFVTDCELNVVKPYGYIKVYQKDDTYYWENND